MNTQELGNYSEIVASTIIKELEDKESVVVIGNIDIQDVVTSLYERSHTNMNVQMMHYDNQDNARIILGNKRIFIGSLFANHPSTFNMERLFFMKETINDLGDTDYIKHPEGVSTWKTFSNS